VNPCEAVSDLVGAYLFGDLEPRDVAALESHLRACRRCRDDVAQRRRALAAVAGQTPTAAERARIMQAVRGEAARRDGALSGGIWWMRRAVMMVGASGVAAALLFGGVRWGEQRASFRAAPGAVARAPLARPRAAAPAAAPPKESAAGVAARVSKPQPARLSSRVQRRAPRLPAAPEPAMQVARVVAPVPDGVDDVRTAGVEE